MFDLVRGEAVVESDVRMDLLRPSETSTACPYKGWAEYWHVAVGGQVHEDLVWGSAPHFQSRRP